MSLCLGKISKDFTLNNMKKNRVKRKCKTLFLLIIMPLIRAIFMISIDNDEDNMIRNNVWIYLKNVYRNINKHS